MTNTIVIIVLLLAFLFWGVLILIIVRFFRGLYKRMEDIERIINDLSRKPK